MPFVSDATRTSTGSVSSQKDQRGSALQDLAQRAQRVANNYVRLCGEFQELSRQGYVPEEFFERVVQFSAEEQGLLQDERVKDVYHGFLGNAFKTLLSRQAIPVPGDGDCGIHSVAVGFILQSHRRDVVKKLQDQIQSLPQSRDTALVLTGLSQLPGRREQLMRDRAFMDALARVLRQVGHKEIPKLYNIDRVSNPQSQAMIRNLIPKEQGKWASEEGLIALAKIIGLKVRIDEVIGGRRVYTGELDDPDFDIRLRGGHFTPIVDVSAGG